MVTRAKKSRVVSAASWSAGILPFWYDRTVTKEDGTWVAKSHLVRFSAYGHTKASAVGRLHKGIVFIVNSLGNRRGAAGIRAWLDARGIGQSFPSGAIADDGAEDSLEKPVR